MEKRSSILSNPPQTNPLYQAKKLYIENLAIDAELHNYETELQTFLSLYGPLIDLKIMQNSSLIS